MVDLTTICLAKTDNAPNGIAIHESDEIETTRLILFEGR